MNHRNLIKAAVAALCATAASASMAALVSGGATLPQDLYNDVRVINDTQAAGGTALFTYGRPGVGSGKGKSAFFENDQFYLGNLNHVSPVHFVGSDSVITGPITDPLSEIGKYNAGTVAASAGKLIQVPAVGTSIAVAFNKSGVSSLNLTSDQLCAIFSGKDALGNDFNNWNQIDSSFPNKAIKVVYRSEGSGTTEIFVRHLNAVCGSGKFTVSNLFTTAHVGAEPLNWVAAAGNPGVRAAIDAEDGTIGYVSPDFINSKPVAGLFNKHETAAARLPAGNNDVSVALGSSVAVPATAADRADPTKWVPAGPAIADPAAGYPIVGTTNLIVSQCYQNGADRDNALSVLSRFFDRTHGSYAPVKTAIGDHHFIALGNTFIDGVKASFINGIPGENLHVGLASDTRCGGKGR